MSAAIGAFGAAMNEPRGQIVNRGTLLKELETDVAALLAHVAAVDDLVLQFEGTPAGRHFVEAWNRARIIVDCVAHAGNGDAAKANGGTPPAAMTAPAK